MRSLGRIFHATRLPVCALFVAPSLLIPLLMAGTGCGGPAEPAVPQKAHEPPTPPPVPPAPETPSAPLASTPGEVSVDIAALDKSVSPCDDFYQYACGSWMKNTPIPDDQASWARSFTVIRERNESILKDILEKNAAARAKTVASTAATEKKLGIKVASIVSDETARGARLGDFYGSCMNETVANKNGVKPLKGQLASIAAVKDIPSLALELARMHTYGVDVLFNFRSGQDFKNASEVIGIVSQGGLGLPDRDYYLVDDAKKKEVRAAYEAHIEKLLGLVGDSAADAKKTRESVMRIETALAQASMSKVDQRDPDNVYHRIDLPGLKLAAPDFPWEAYMKAVGAPGVVALNVAQPEFMTAANGMLKGVPMADWRMYLRWHLVKSQARRLNDALEEEDFNFRRAITGAAKNLPRWKRCVRATDEALGEALAQSFVKETLGAEGKAVTKAMIADIESAMKANLGTLSWMDAATRERAAEKLGLIANKIGYPDTWRNYDALKIVKDNFLANAMSADAFEVKRQLAKIGKPVDRTEWEMTPPTVNAYYEPSLNEMVFPAGILQPPFFSDKQTLPTNLGGIGMVMGHELTHGFDDEGRRFDGQGNLKEWWSKPVGAEFEKRAACVAKQYDTYAPFPDAHVNGKLTLGENIADLGGVKLAFAALQKTRGGKPLTSSNGFGEDQQFFLGFAQGWCTNMRDQMLRLQVATNPHSPPRYRVNGPLSNLPEFAHAFSCKEGSAMVRPASQRCEVW